MYCEVKEMKEFLVCSPHLYSEYLNPSNSLSDFVALHNVDSSFN